MSIFCRYNGIVWLLIGIVTVIGCSVIRVDASIINAESCSRPAVETAVESATNGDTVLVPAGTCVWTSTMRISKGVILKGAGIDKSVIVDEIPRSNADKPIFILTTAEGTSPRISGFTLARGTVNTEKHFNGAVVVTGRSKAWRIDNLKFSRLATPSIRVYGDTYGVIDHSVFDLVGTQAIIVWHDTWGGKSFGDGSWADASYWGTEKAVYIEDNTFSQAITIGALDCMGGGRYVFRHNVVLDEMAGNHGTESTGRIRSCRVMEVYNNKFKKSGTKWFTGLFIRGGTGVFFNNTFDGYNFGITLRNFRIDQSYGPWGKCDGSSPYDGSELLNGYPCIDQVGRGRGKLLSGSTPTPVEWPLQEMEPLYEWNNLLNGSAARMGPDRPLYIELGREYFNNTPKPGYKPFVYPHPLVSGATMPSPPNPPSGLIVK